MKLLAPSPIRAISNDIQGISHGILSDGLHDHREQGKITIHIPKKEKSDTKALSNEDRKLQTTIGERDMQNGDRGRVRQYYQDARTGTFDRLEGEGNSPSSGFRSLAKDVESYRQQLWSTQKELEEVKQRYRDSERTVDALMRANFDLQQEVHKAKERESMYIKIAEKLAKDAEQKAAQQETENTILRERLRASEDTIQRTTTTLRERTADLKGVQTFLNTADLYSGAEIISMVESLNTDFFQISAFLADLIEDEEMAATEEEWAFNKSNLVPKFSNDVQYFAGQKLYAHICNSATRLRTDALPVQLAFQATLTGWCIHHLRVLCWGQLNHKFEEIYKNIRSSETQAVSGRWRAITTANVAENFDDTRRLFDVIGNLLHLCGWSAQSPQAQKVIPTIKDMVTSMQKKIVQFRRAVKEGITTAEMEVFAHGPGTLFHEKMDDIYKTSIKHGVEPEQANRHILCTVGMGLQKSFKKDNESSSQVDILLKPQVILESILNENNFDVVVPAM